MTEKFTVGGMTCAACQAHVERAAKSVEGVSEAAVSLLTNSMTVTFDSPATVDKICEAVAKSGYSAQAESADKKSTGRHKLPENRDIPILKRRLIASLILLIPLMYVSMGALMWDWWLPSSFADNFLAIGLYELVLTALIMVINQRFFVSGFKGLVHRSPNMDSLVALGSGSSFLYSLWQLFKMTDMAKNGQFEMTHHLVHGLYFESAATILTLITVGKLLEAVSKGRTSDAIKSLMDLAPKTAHLIRDGKEITIPAEELKVGDIFLIKPGESAPADGVIIEGTTSVDESALTGESIPVDKVVGDSVSAATINQNGAVTCRAVHVSGDTALDKIIQMVEDASASKAPIAKTADRVSGIFVPTVIAIALITGAVWLLVGKDFGYALSRAVSVLVISCPCALGLATPVAIMVGSGVGAKNGILFKTAAALEQTGRTQIAILDKTGTVTEGKPTVTDILPTVDSEKDLLLQTAFALEEKSEHPLAKAVMGAAEGYGKDYPKAEGFTAVTGHGVQGFISGKEAIGGNASVMREKGLLTKDMVSVGERLAGQGKTPLFFGLDGRLLGIIAVADSIKPDSKEAVKQLKSMGLVPVMLTGDNRRTALAIASQAGIEKVISDVQPYGKEEVVRRLSDYGKTAMIGDGINDAPALTRADVGIAIGAGADVAVESADAVLMNSRLTDVTAAIRLSRKTLRNIHENLFWAFFYNCIGIPLAAGVFIHLTGWELNPMFGAAAMSLSSFTVVTNALRLNLFNPKTAVRDKAAKQVTIPEELFGEYTIKSEWEELKMTKTVTVKGMMCQHCVAHVKKALEAIDGVTAAEVSLENGSATVTMSKEVADSVIEAAIVEAGYEV